MKVVGTIVNANELEVTNIYTDETVIKTISEDIPPNRPINIPIGKEAKLCLNLETDTIFWKLIDRELTQEEIIEKQSQEIETLKYLVAELALGGGAF